MKVLRIGTVSTNVYLRRLYNFCVDMNWLPWPIVPKRQWPIVRFQEKRAITWEEHCRIVEREKNPERKAFYQLAWHLGASQSDLAHLHAEDVDWPNRVISFFRMKTRWRSLQPPQIRFGKEVEAILAALPKLGELFPSLANVRPGDRATEFKQRCDGLGIRGISLHSYRYHGRSGRRRPAIQNDLPSWPWATTVRPSTVPTPRKRRSRYLLLRNTRRRSCPLLVADLSWRRLQQLQPALEK